MKVNFVESTSVWSHAETVIKWLLEEVMSAGGDGIWYSKYLSISQIESIITNGNLLPKYWTMEVKNGELHLGENQEWLIITNDKNSFDNRPSWQQVSLDW